jgi:hypothetical protein
MIRVIKSRRMRWMGHVALIRETRNTHRISIGNPEGMRSLGRPRRRWENDIRVIGKVWAGFIWLSRGTSGGLLW